MRADHHCQPLRGFQCRPLTVVPLATSARSLSPYQPPASNAYGTGNHPPYSRTGGLPVFRPDQPGPTNDSDTEKALRRFQQAATSIQDLADKTD